MVDCPVQYMKIIDHTLQDEARDHSVYKVLLIYWDYQYVQPMGFLLKNHLTQENKNIFKSDWWIMLCHQNNNFIIAFFYKKLMAIEKEEHYQKQEKMTMHAFESRVIMKWLSEKGFLLCSLIIQVRVVLR